jgi:hypothetical protein
MSEYKMELEKVGPMPCLLLLPFIPILSVFVTFAFFFFFRRCLLSSSCGWPRTAEKRLP